MTPLPLAIIGGGNDIVRYAFFKRMPLARRMVDSDSTYHPLDFIGSGNLYNMANTENEMQLVIESERFNNTFNDVIILSLGR